MSAHDAERDQTEHSRLLLRPAEAADVLGIGRRKLWSLTANGELPAVRIGRSVRYSVDDLRDFIDQLKAGGR